MSLVRMMSVIVLLCSSVAVCATEVESGPAGEEPSVAVFDSTLTLMGGTVEISDLRPNVSPTAAVLMTPVFPGWGQMAADNGWRSVAVFAFDMFYMTRAIMHDRKAERSRARLAHLDPGGFNDYYHDKPGQGTVYVKEHIESMRDNFWWAGSILLIAALDAYVGAHLQNFDRDDAPVPEGWDPADVPQPVELPTASPVGVVLMSWRTSF